MCDLLYFFNPVYQLSAYRLPFKNVLNPAYDLGITPSSCAFEGGSSCIFVGHLSDCVPFAAATCFLRRCLVLYRGRCILFSYSKVLTPWGSLLGQRCVNARTKLKQWEARWLGASDSQSVARGSGFEPTTAVLFR